MEGTRKAELEQPKTEATVVQIVQESDTIKRIVLQVNNKLLSFKAGQWVDFFIPGMTIFTGFSMCSAPHLLRETGRLELAIKYSDYPPTEWVHTQCKVGDKVYIRVGGTFFHEIPSYPTAVSDILLIAAGIGINPMVSIYQHFVHEQSARRIARGARDTADEKKEEAMDGKLCLLYTARTIKELVFKNEILSMANSCPNVDVQMFCTQQHVTDQDKVSNGRITSTVIRHQISKLDKTKLHVFICGPPGFIDDMEQYCVHEGLEASQIHYEKWW